MRALTRMRTLAAACALLLMIAGTAVAGAPGRPIDRPDSPPPQPTEVGEPDAGHNLTVQLFRQLIVAATLSNPYLRWLGLPMRFGPTTTTGAIRFVGRRR